MAMTWHRPHSFHFGVITVYAVNVFNIYLTIWLQLCYGLECAHLLLISWLITIYWKTMVTLWICWYLLSTLLRTKVFEWIHSVIWVSPYNWIGTLPYELQPSFFQIGYALPSAQVITASRYILFGSDPQGCGRAIGNKMNYD